MKSLLFAGFINGGNHLGGLLAGGPMLPVGGRVGELGSAGRGRFRGFAGGCSITGGRDGGGRVGETGAAGSGGGGGARGPPAGGGGGTRRPPAGLGGGDGDLGRLPNSSLGLEERSLLRSLDRLRLRLRARFLLLRVEPFDFLVLLGMIYY